MWFHEAPVRQWGSEEVRQRREGSRWRVLLNDLVLWATGTCSHCGVLEASGEHTPRGCPIWGARGQGYLSTSSRQSLPEGCCQEVFIPWPLQPARPGGRMALCSLRASPPAKRCRPWQVAVGQRTPEQWGNWQCLPQRLWLSCSLDLAHSTCSIRLKDEAGSYLLFCQSKAGPHTSRFKYPWGQTVRWKHWVWGLWPLTLASTPTLGNSWGQGSWYLSCLALCQGLTHSRHSTPTPSSQCGP